MLYEHHRRNSPSYKIVQRLVILPPDAINSDPPAMTRQLASSRVLHLMGEDDTFRESVFRRGFAQICSRVTMSCGNDSINTSSPHNDNNENVIRELQSNNNDGSDNKRRQAEIKEIIQKVSHLLQSNFSKPNAIHDPYEDEISEINENISIHPTCVDEPCIEWSNLAPQLSLHRRELLESTLLIYGRLVAQSLDRYRDNAKVGCMGLKETRLLSNRCHHFSHALWHYLSITSNNLLDSDNLASRDLEYRSLSWRLREEVFRIMYENIVHRRVLHARRQDRNSFNVCLSHGIAKGNSENNSNERDENSWFWWPEHLKLVAEAGQHLMGPSPEAEAAGETAAGLQRRSDTARQVSDILFEILGICHIKQQDAVRLMVAHTFMDRSLLAMDYFRIFRNNFENRAPVPRNIIFSYDQYDLLEYMLDKVLTISASITINGRLPINSRRRPKIPEYSYFYDYYLENSAINADSNYDINTSKSDSDSYSDVGWFGLSQDSTALLFAVIAFQTSFEVSRTMGTHVLLGPASHLATMLATKKR